MLRLCSRTRPGYSNAVVRSIGQWTPDAPVASVSNAATAAAAAAPASGPPAAASPSVAASAGLPPLFSSTSASLPSGVRVLSVASTTPPDSSPSADGDGSASSTAALRSLEEQRRPGLLATLQRMRSEFRESIHAKFTQPHKVMEKAYGPMWTGFSRRWKGRIGLLTGAKRPEHRVVTDFSPSTDLSAFTLLNDNNFGGTSTCGLELRERVVTDELTGAQSLRYSVVFKGELHSLMPFQNDSALRSGKREKVLPRPMPKENAPQPSLLSSQPPPVQRPSGLVSQPPKNKSSAPLSDLDEPVAATGTQQTDKSAAVAESDVPAEQALPPKPASKSFFRMPSLLQPPENGPINGFAAMIFPNFAYPELDLELFDFLSMNVRTDGRAYMFNVRCFSNTFESVDGFVYQARIREEQPRPMHKLEVRFENFMCTQHGRARSFASPLPKGRILSFGFSVTGPPGPFEIELESISANVGTPEFELKARAATRAAAAAERALRTQQRIDQLEKRQRVQVELERLRAERNAAKRKADFDAGLLRTLLAENARLAARAQEEDTSGFPIEFQEERKREMAEQQARNQADLAQAQSQQATATAEATAPSKPKPRSLITEERRREIELQVQDEMEEEEKERQVPWGLGDERSGPAK